MSPTCRHLPPCRYACHYGVPLALDHIFARDAFSSLPAPWRRRIVRTSRAEILSLMTAPQAWRSHDDLDD